VGREKGLGPFFSHKLDLYITSSFVKAKIYQKYCGPLDIPTIIDGIKKCFSNALFLYKEAEHCSKRRKYSLAYYLLCVSEEEYIKSYLLISYFTIVNSEGIGKFWSYYQNHKPKKRLILLKRHMQDKNTRTYLENIYFLINQQSYENIKQSSLYCDCVISKRFIKPDSVFVKKDITEEIVRLSKTYREWGKMINNDKELSNAVQFLKNNPSEIVSPDIVFKKIYGKHLFEK